MYLQLQAIICRRMGLVIVTGDTFNSESSSSPFEPECVVLVISEVDTSFFVLNADLWDSRGTHELNIVMHPVFCNPESTTNYSSAYDNQAPVPGPSGQTVPIPGSSGQTSAISSINHLCGPSSACLDCDYACNSPSYPRPALDSPAKPNGEIAYTRNLIGALAQSASRLQGMDGQPGIFFIFHDLSVRTEGIFCLRFTLVVLGNHNHFTDQPTDILASTFSEPFQVYSAKKLYLCHNLPSTYQIFPACDWHSHSPGMLGPTALTKHFSGQRVRIPTRRRKVKDEGAESTDEEVEDDEN
ncbi:hypothetical protein KEM48_006831 [Puccinia striiformis f. sp. tritici PST-130]|nr:hypothetical protein KEM48_006831 [Puccinia striiformis f. sp. tritici PST-130]